MTSINQLIVKYLFEISSVVFTFLVILSAIFALNPTAFVKTKIVGLETAYLTTLASSNDDATFTFENYKDFNIEQKNDGNSFKVLYKNTKNEFNGKYFGSDVSISKTGSDLVIRKEKI